MQSRDWIDDMLCHNIGAEWKERNGWPEVPLIIPLTHG